MPTPYRKYPELTGSLTPDVPYSVNAALRAIDEDIEKVERATGESSSYVDEQVAADRERLDELEDVRVPGALSDAKEYTDAVTETMLDGTYDTAGLPGTYAGITDTAGNLLLGWKPDGHLHPHTAKIYGQDVAGLFDIHIPGVFATAIDEAGNIMWTQAMDGTLAPAVAPAPEVEIPEPVLPRVLLAAADTTRWSWWGSSTMGHMASRYTAQAARHAAPTVYSGGNGGESAEHTLARFGSRPAVLVSPVTVPASGPVNISVNLPPHSGAMSWDVNLGGIRGMAAKAAGSNQYVFTRSAAGSAVKLFPGMQLIPTKGQEFRGGLLILNIGKNNLTGVSGTADVQTLVDWTVAAWNHASHTGVRVLVLGHWLDRDAKPTDPEWDKILDYNMRVRTLLSAPFLDTHAMVTDPGLWAKIGITPTAQDTAAQAAGTKPPSLSSDSLHLTDAGLDLLDAATEAKLLSLAWIK